MKQLIEEKIKLFHKKNLHDAPPDELIGLFSGYDVLKVNDYNGIECGGYCDGRNKIIALADVDFTNKDKHTILHELSHSIQFELECFETTKENLLSFQAQIEWQAESIAYHLFKGCYKQNVNHKKFNTYFKKEDLLWLHEWYGGAVENDLI